MSSTRDYGCEIMSFVVLLVLSALSHFWYIMIVMCAGIAIWGMAAVVTRIFLNRMVVPVPEFGSRAERENAMLRSGMLRGVLGPREPSASSFAPNPSQESL